MHDFVVIAISLDTTPEPYIAILVLILHYYSLHFYFLLRIFCLVV